MSRHEDAAREHMEAAEVASRNGARETAWLELQLAKLELGFAEVEQRRVRNLIALAGLAAPNGFENEVYEARIEALMEGLLDTEQVATVAGYGPAGVDERAFIRPEIAEVLGLDHG